MKKFQRVPLQPTAFGKDFLEEVFDRVYIINLVDRVDRKAEMTAQLALIGLASDDPLVEWVAASRPTDRGDFPSVGARGCFQSHLDILGRAVAGGYRSILILEDDVDWTRAALSFDPTTLSELLNTDWKLLHGGHGADGYMSAEGGLTLEPMNPAEDVLLTHFIGLRDEAIPAAHAHLGALLTRPKGSSQGGPMHVDGAYTWLRRGNPGMASYICRPSLARQRPSMSDVTPPSGWRSLPGVGKTLGTLRHLRKKLGV